MEHKEMAAEWLNKAKQQLAKANQQAIEATKQVEEIRVCEEGKGSGRNHG